MLMWQEGSGSSDNLLSLTPLFPGGGLSEMALALYLNFRGRLSADGSRQRKGAHSLPEHAENSQSQAACNFLRFSQSQTGRTTCVQEKGTI